MKNIAGIMSCIVLGALSANAKVEYRDYDTFGKFVYVSGDETASNVLAELDKYGVSLSEVKLNLMGDADQGKAKLVMDKALDASMLSMANKTYRYELVFDNQYGSTPLKVNDEMYIDDETHYPSTLAPVTITFSPTKDWEGVLTCEILASADDTCYNLWGAGDPKTEQGLQDYMKQYYSFTLGGLADGFALASETGFVASADDVAPGTVGVVLDVNRVEGTSLFINSMTLIAKVDSHGHAVDTPEPTTGALSLLALAGLCARRRRK